MVKTSHLATNKPSSNEIIDLTFDDSLDMLAEQKMLDKIPDKKMLDKDYHDAVLAP